MRRAERPWHIEMYKWGILCMLTALVAILTIQYYMFEEGFTDAMASAIPKNGLTVHSDGFTNAPPAAPGTSAPATGTPATAADLSGTADLSGVTISMPADDATPETTAAIPAAWKQEWSKMIRDLQQVVRSEIKKGRMEQLAAAAPAAAAAATPSTLQGVEYAGGSVAGGCANGIIQPSNGSSTTNPVDMSQYVRKDSIPCWNCNLDY